MIYERPKLTEEERRLLAFTQAARDTKAESRDEHEAKRLYFRFTYNALAFHYMGVYVPFQGGRSRSGLR